MALTPWLKKLEGLCLTLEYACEMKPVPDDMTQSRYSYPKGHLREYDVIALMMALLKELEKVPEIPLDRSGMIEGKKKDHSNSTWASQSTFGQTNASMTGSMSPGRMSSAKMSFSSRE